MVLTPLFLLAGYLVFRLVVLATLADKAARRFWENRVAVALLAGVVFWKLAPFFTRWETIFDNPLLLLYMNGGFPALLGACSMAAAIAAVGVWQLRKTTPLPRWRLWTPLAAGAALTIGLLLAQPVWEGRPPAPPAAAVQALSPGVDGVPGALADARGKVLIVNFWATWCPPCLAELPELQDFSTRIGANTLLWGVDLTATETGGADKVKDFVKTHKIGWRQLLDPSGALQKAFAVNSVPTTLVFDPSGALVERRVGAVDLSWLLSLESRYGRPGH